MEKPEIEIGQVWGSKYDKFEIISKKHYPFILIKCLNNFEEKYIDSVILKNYFKLKKGYNTPLYKALNNVQKR